MLDGNAFSLLGRTDPHIRQPQRGWLSGDDGLLRAAFQTPNGAAIHVSSDGPRHLPVDPDVFPFQLSGRQGAHGLWREGAGNYGRPGLRADLSPPHEYAGM